MSITTNKILDLLPLMHQKIQCPHGVRDVACEEILKIDEEVEKAAQDLQEILEDRQRKLDAINPSHSLIIRELPIEILCTIFRFSISQEDPQDPGSALDWSGCAAPLKLGAICSAWRQIAWADPQLWTRVMFKATRASPPSPTRYELLKEYLERSKSLRIDMILKEEEDVYTADFELGGYWKFCLFRLTETVRKWRSIDWELQYHSLKCIFARLKNQEATLDTLVVRHFSAPEGEVSLASLSSRTAPQIMARSVVFLHECPDMPCTINWASVTRIRFDVYQRSWVQVLDFLKMVPKLEECFIGHIKSTAMRPLPESIPPHNHLQRLDLIDIRDGAHELFHYVDFPHLRKLRRRCFGDELISLDMSSFLLNFLRRSSCSLTHLDLDTKFSMVDLIRVLDILPTLIDLKVEFRAVNADIEISHFLCYLVRVNAQGKVPLPALESLGQRVMVNYPWRLVTEIFCIPSEATQNATRKPIKSMVVDRDSSSGSNPALPSIVHGRLVALQNEGMTIMYNSVPISSLPVDPDSVALRKRLLLDFE